MTSEQRQYLKSAIDAHRREALARDGDRKFRHHTPEEGDDGAGQIRPLIAVIAMVNITVLMSLALMVEHLAR